MRLLAGDLSTGLIKVRNIPATRGDVMTAIGEAGTITCVVKYPLVDPNTGVTIALSNLIAPAKSFLAFEDDNGNIINAGPIWYENFDFDASEYTLTAAGLASYYDYRKVLPALNDALSTDTPIGHDTSIVNFDLATIAKKLVQQAHTWSHGSMNVVFPADVVSTNYRNMLGVDIESLGDNLAGISGVQNGPDIDFRPRYSSDGNHIEWVMTMGTPLTQSPGADWIWDTTVPTPSVKGLNISRDGTVLVTDAYEVGTIDTTTTLPLMAKSVDTTLTALGYPRMEAVDQRPTVIDVPTLTAHAAEDTFSGRFYLETWKFQASRSVYPVLGSYHSGDYATMILKDNGYKTAGRYRMRITRITAHIDSQFVELETTPVMS